MDNRLLPHFDELDAMAALQRFTEIYDGSHGDAGEALGDMAKAVVHLSVDLSKHGIRELALALRDTGIEVNGWSFESLKLKSRYDLAFTMAKDGAGYLVRAKIDPEMTAAAAKKMEVFHRQRVDRLSAVKAEQGLEGAEYEKTKWKILFTESIPEEDAVKADPASYKPIDDCFHVEEVLCVAFAPKGRLPEGRSLEECATLKEIIDRGLDGYLSSKIFEISPEGMFDRGWAENPTLPPLPAVRDFEAALLSLRIAGEGIRAAGLMSKVDDFVSSRKATQYRFIGDDQSAPVIELAAASVATSGIVTGQTADAVASLWQMTAAIDAGKAASDILSVAGALSANGHTSSTARYECNDADDFVWIEDSGDGATSLWLRGQNGNYRVDVDSSEGELDMLRLFRVSANAYRDGTDSQSPGASFICEFRSSPDGLQAHVFEEMTMRRIRDVNNILLTLRSVACCLEADYGAGKRLDP